MNPLPPEAVACLDNGDVIGAVKATRAARGSSLLEAKQAVDAHRRGKGRAPLASNQSAQLVPGVAVPWGERERFPRWLLAALGILIFGLGYRWLLG